MSEDTTYCSECRLLLLHCICAERPTLTSSLHWCLLTHATEAHKRNNSGFHVRKVLPDSVNPVPWSRVSTDLDVRCRHQGREPVLLFPADCVVNSDQVFFEYQPEWQGRPLIIVDATWQQAKKIYRQSDWLQGLPVWDVSRAFTEPVLEGFHYALRKNQTEFGCSTIETVAQVMALKGERSQAQALLTYFDRFQQDKNDPSRTR